MGEIYHGAVSSKRGTLGGREPLVCGLREGLRPTKGNTREYAHDEQCTGTRIGLAFGGENGFRVLCLLCMLRG